MNEAAPAPAAESELEPSNTESLEKPAETENLHVAEVSASSEIPDETEDPRETEAAEVSVEEEPSAPLKPASERKLKKRFDKPPEPVKAIKESEVEPTVEIQVKQEYKPESRETIPLPAPVPVHANPLLVEDQPYRAEEEVNTPVPGEAVVLIPPAVPEAPAEPAIAAAPIVETVTSSPSPNETAETMETAVPEILDDPAVSAAAPSRLLESPGEFTITLEGLGWIFRSDRSTPGSWRFLERELKGESTNFRFMFTESGDWNLVFERQDLSSGGSENEVRKVIVAEDDGLPHIENGPLPESYDNPIPGTLPGDPDSRNLAARDAVEKDRVEDAMKFWEVDASRDDEDGRRARAALVKSAVASDSINPLLTWLPRYMDENPASSVLAGALDLFESHAGYEEQSRMILEKLAASDNDGRQAEWLYRLASYLEKPGDNRDLDRSATLYQEVINSWPLSDWRDRSEERLLWLRRHYFRVR